MTKIGSLRTLFIEEMRDMLDAETRLTKALPKLIKKATSPDLKTALQSHLVETEEHVSRLEQAFEILGAPARRKTCHGIMGLVEEAEEHLGEEFETDAIRDAVVIGAGQKAEHYEIAAYGTAITYAHLLGQDDVAELLQDTLEEEKAADAKLTEIAVSTVNEQAARGGSENEAGEEASGPRDSNQRRSRNG
jgi:ferritin-like metal-binding protein YciE